MKRIKILLLSILMIFNIDKVDALGSNTVDFNEKGSIEITLFEKKDNVKIEGAELTIYKIANAHEKNHNLVLEYVSELSSCNVSLDDLESADVASNIEKCIPNDYAGISKLTNQDGYVKYDNLDLGLYLIKQTNKVDGFSKIDSFLSMIPKVIDNKWEYDIKATPKTDIIRVMDIHVRKVWNTSNNNTNHSINLPKSIVVELLLNEEIVDTIKLDNENEWKHTWIDLPKSDSYTVREINVPKGWTVTYQKEDNSFIVTNTSTLVQTGQMLWIVLLIGMIGVIFIIASLVYDKVSHEQNS